MVTRVSRVTLSGACRGLFAAVPQAGMGLGYAMSAVTVAALVRFLPTDVWPMWGARVPGVVSIGLLAIGGVIFLRGPETAHFDEAKQQGLLVNLPLLEVSLRGD
jgi:hypothetical protein